MSSSKKIYQRREFAAGVYLSEAPSPPMTPLPPPLHSVHVYTAYLLFINTGKGGDGGGGCSPERSLEGQQFTMLGRKYQHDWLYKLFKL